MADDPNRDILPVREASCVDTCRSSIDHRERHLVYKLDRYELEDKYLRLLEEVRSLKKLSNCQEDKIKRLATKLMRVTANPRACTVTLDVFDDKNRIITLEFEISKLKDKISVLKNQLLSHKISGSGRSSSRSHNPQGRPSSGRITYRTESSRTKIPSCHCITETGDDDNDAQNNLDKIEKFDAEKKEMANRIAELEKELLECTASNQRIKIDENIEYIKVWRQMKQLNDKLIAAENTNKSLNAQIDDLKWKLEEATKRNYEITASLDAERKRLADEQMLKANESQFSLREKDEQIKDLMNEMKILQQHNNELVDLSSRRGDVEQENIELKKKVTEQLHDQETLRNAFNSEQAHITALRASNEQLIGKLGELQKNIDSLTTQTEKQEMSKTTQISTKQTDMRNPRTTDNAESYKSVASPMERCKKCCEAFEKILQLEENICVSRGNANPVDKCVQTESVTRLNPVNMKDQTTSIATPVKENPKKSERVKEPVKENVEQMSTENPLTPEKMLKLLEQAQFNTPSDSMKFVQKNMINDVNYNMSDFNQRHRQVVSLEKLLFGDSGC